MVGIVKIVQHVDAAAKNRVLVHHAQLAVQAAPPVWHQQAQARAQWRINTPLNARFIKPPFPFRRKRCGADAINQDLYGNAACCGAGQRVRHVRTGAMHVKNIGFELNPALGTVKRLDQRGEIRLPAFE